MSHPEDFCEKCGRENIVWFAPDDLWNKVVGSPNGILCPVCFAKLAQAAGVDGAWSVAPGQRSVQVTISGKVGWTPEFIDELVKGIKEATDNRDVLK